MIDAPKLNCPYCGKPYNKEAIDAQNGLYGCETGCLYISYYLICPSCHKEVDIGGQFGSFDNEEEKWDYIDNLNQEEVQKIINHIKNNETRQIYFTS